MGGVLLWTGAVPVVIVAPSVLVGGVLLWTGAVTLVVVAPIL